MQLGISYTCSYLPWKDVFTLCNHQGLNTACVRHNIYRLFAQYTKDREQTQWTWCDMEPDVPIFICCWSNHSPPWIMTTAIASAIAFHPKDKIKRFCFSWNEQENDLHWCIKTAITAVKLSVVDREVFCHLFATACQTQDSLH